MATRVAPLKLPRVARLPGSMPDGWLSLVRSVNWVRERHGRSQFGSVLTEGSQPFDVIVVDAFSSDAIPVHLLTKECAEVYQRHLQDDGLLAIHISNRYLDLNPITRGIAEHLGWQAVRIESDDDSTTGVYSSTWVIVTGNQEFLSTPEVTQAHWDWTEDDIAPILWTDDFASLYQIMSD